MRTAKSRTVSKPGHTADVKIYLAIIVVVVEKFSESQQHPGEVLLSLSDVYYSVNTRRGPVDILKGVTFTARAGEVTVLLGPNGAGKTTSLTLAQGLAEPSSGKVSLLGESPWRAGADLRSQVGVMLQDGGLPPSITGARLLAHVQSLYKAPADIEQLMSDLDIGEFRNTQIRRLSGGQRQRIAFAAALIGRPQVVFLDEPSAGLDPVSRQVVITMIERLKQANVAIILTTHLLEDAHRLADHVVLINNGVVEKSGTVAELTNSLDKPPLCFSVDRHIGSDELATFPEHLQITAQEELSQKESGNYQWRVTGADSSEDLVAITQWWHSVGLMPVDISMTEKTLEDVFWQLNQ